MKTLLFCFAGLITLSSCTNNVNYQLEVGGDKYPFVINTKTGEVFRCRDLKSGEWYSLGIPHQKIRMFQTDELYNLLKEREFTTKTVDEFYSEIKKTEYRDILYNLMSREGLYHKSRSDFENEYFYTNP